MNSIYCRSCSFFLGAGPGKFCPNCGQDTATHAPSAMEFLHDSKIRVGKAGPLIAVSANDASAMKTPFMSMIECDLGSTPCTKLKTYLREKYQDQSMAEVGRQVKERMISLAPYAIFAFLPVFALLTRLLYRRRRLLYGEHLVYAFHGTHSRFCCCWQSRSPMRRSVNCCTRRRGLFLAGDAVRFRRSMVGHCIAFCRHRHCLSCCAAIGASVALDS